MIASHPLKQTYTKIGIERDHSPLIHTKDQRTREFEINQNLKNLVLIRICMTRPVLYPLTRDKKDIQSTKNKNKNTG